MAKTKKTSKQVEKVSHSASTPENKENYLISLAYNLAEQRLKDKTATAQEVVHFLKLGSTKEKLEKELIKQKVELAKAKTDESRSAEELKALYIDAMNAMKKYGGYDE